MIKAALPSMVGSPILTAMKPSIILFLATSLAAAAAPDAGPTAPGTSSAPLGLSVSLSSSVSGSTKLKTGGQAAGDAASVEFDQSAAYETALPNGATLTVGHSLHGSYFDLPEQNAVTALPKRLQSAMADFTYSQPCDEQWNAFVTLSPGLRWAGSHAGSGAFAVSGGAGALYRHSDSLTLMLGLGFDSMAHHKVMPGVGVQWMPAARWNVSLGFPRTAITYMVCEPLSLSLVAEGVSDTYHVEVDPLPGLAGKPSLADTKLEYEDYRIGLSAEYRLSPWCNLVATAGCVVERKFDYFDRDYELKSDGTAAYGSLAMSMKF